MATPDRTIDEVCVSWYRYDLTIKSLPGGQRWTLLALLRDQKLHEKVSAFGRRISTRPPGEEYAGVEAGFLGPVALPRNLPLIADVALREGVFVAGANREGFHLRGVIPGKHFEAKFADIHVPMAGDHCPTCHSALKVEKTIEIGNIFKLGTKYSLP
jgi:prolyl-tRNA synthetase